MEKRTEGAWIINHTKKLRAVNADEFEDVEFAGKCGMFLSNLAASDEQFDINKEKVDAIAKVSNLKKTEVDTIKNKLAEFDYIDNSADGSVSVLGITSSTILNHTSDIFNALGPSNYQKAALDLAENVSDLPKGEKFLSEYISDTYELKQSDTNELLLQSEDIGFIDYEKLDENKFYFNGNLFRRDFAAKTSAILSSLKPEETRQITVLDEILTSKGCVTHEKALQILGLPLLAKLQSIGMYDFNEVSNSTEVKIIVTKPSAFSKFGNPFEEDALDLAKAFVSSLFYGMNFSTSGRGQITMLKRLMQKLVDGYEVGSATAIGEDYRLLELKQVIKLRADPNPKKPGCFFMRLLKKDVGELAIHVLEFGDVADRTTAVELYSGSVTKYSGPEQQRVISRKKDSAHSNKGVADLLRTFRN